MSGVPVVRAADSERDQRRAAAALQAAGVRSGDRILVSAAASPELLAVVLGALRTGVVPVVLDPGLPGSERSALAEDAGPALDVGSEPGRLLGDGEADLADVPLARPMHYTSGTTGRRKGVWSGVLADDDARRAGRRGDRPLGVRRGRPAPGAVPPAPQRPAPVRDLHPARRWRGAAARPVRHRPGRRARSPPSARRRRSACPPTCNGCSGTAVLVEMQSTGRRSGCSPTPARPARPR